MADKEFTVTHAKARTPLTIRGKNLAEALAKEGLDPDIWKPVSPSEPEESLSDEEVPTDTAVD